MYNVQNAWRRCLASSSVHHPLTSTPVEQVLSHRGLILRRHRARMSGNIHLVFRKRNAHLCIFETERNCEVVNIKLDSTFY